MEEKLVVILNEMSEYLSITQMKKLQEVLLKNLSYNAKKCDSDMSNSDYLKIFLAAKQIEGCSDRTISYYNSTILHMLGNIKTPIRKISTEEIRDYLANYQKINNCSKTTVDEYSCAMKSHFRTSGNQMSGKWKSSYASLLA